MVFKLLTAANVANGVVRLLVLPSPVIPETIMSRLLALLAGLDDQIVPIELATADQLVRATGGGGDLAVEMRGEHSQTLDQLVAIGFYHCSALLALNAVPPQRDCEERQIRTECRPAIRRSVSPGLRLTRLLALVPAMAIGAGGRPI